MYVFCLQVDFYAQECSPETPLRCDVGDVSGRLGNIAIGSNKYVLTDPNLPLSKYRKGGFNLFDECL